MGSMGSADTGHTVHTAGQTAYVTGDEPIADVLARYAAWDYDVVIRRKAEHGLPPEVDMMGKTLHGLRCYQVDRIGGEVSTRWRRT